MLKSIFIYKRNTRLSRLSRVYPLSKITNSNIGDYTYINLFANINNTDIGKFCSISMNFKAGLGTHPTNFISTSPFFYSRKNALKKSVADRETFEEYKKIAISNDVWIGADVIILDGVSVGNGAIIATKSVVTKDVPDYAIVGGVPARIIRYRFDKETIKLLNEIAWWNWKPEVLKENIHLFNEPLDQDKLSKLKMLNKDK